MSANGYYCILIPYRDIAEDVDRCDEVQFSCVSVAGSSDVIDGGIFLNAGQVRWDIGLILALGNMLGAWVAVRVAVAKGAVFVRWLLIIVLTGAGLKLTGTIDLILQLFG